MFFNEPENPISYAKNVHILKNPSTLAGFEPANIGSQGEHWSWLLAYEICVIITGYTTAGQIWILLLHWIYAVQSVRQFRPKLLLS